MTSVETGTTELALPGLEGQISAAQPRPGHWIERGPWKRLMVFSGRSHPDLAQKISEHLGVETGEVTLKTFATDETYCRYEESIRGADVFLVQTGRPPVDKNLMELLLMIQAAKLASAKRITAVVPWFPYSRQDRKAKPREPISARLVADMLQLAGVDRVLTMDLHAGQIQGFFNIPVDNVYATPVLLRYIRERVVDDEPVTVVSPDAGGVERARAFAKRLNANLAIIDKRRAAANEVAEMHIIGEVTGKVAVVIDDIVDTAGTICAAADALRAAGAQEVFACCTHAVLSGPAIDRITKSSLKKLVVTDTIPLHERAKQANNIAVLPVAPLIGEAIRRIHNEESISSLFI